jgi:hypothetical protein
LPVTALREAVESLVHEHGGHRSRSREIDRHESQGCLRHAAPVAARDNGLGPVCGDDLQQTRAPLEAELEALRSLQTKGDG